MATEPTPAPAPPAPPQPLPTQIPSTTDDRTMAIVCYLGSIMTFFLLPALIWLLKKDESRFVDDQGKEAVNFQILLAGAYFVSFILMLIPYIGFIGSLLIIVLWLGNAALSVMAAMAVNKGELFRYPYLPPNLRILK